MPTFLIVLGLLALLLLLAGTLWIELVITCSSNNLRFGLCWHWSKYQVAIPLYQFQLRTAQPPATTGTRRHYKTGGRLRSARPVLLTFVRFIMPYSSLDVSGSIVIGTGDAAATGILTGIMWQILGWAKAVSQALMTSGTFKVTIEPRFNTVVFNVNIRCIVFLPLLHIITAVVRTVKHLSRSTIEQGGRKLWQSIQFKG